MVITLAVLFFAFLMVRISSRGRGSMLVSLWPIALLLLIVSWHRLIAWRRSHMQLWLHARGIELIPSTEEARRALWWTQVLNVSLTPIGLVLSVITARDAETRWMMGILALIFGGGTLLIAYQYHRANPRVHVRVGDFERRLIPWSAITEFDMLKVYPSRASVRMKYRARLIGPLDFGNNRIKLDAPIADRQFEALRNRIESWRFAAMSSRAMKNAPSSR